MMEDCDPDLCTEEKKMAMKHSFKRIESYSTNKLLFEHL